MTIPPEIEAVCLLGWHIYPASPTSKAACIKSPTDQASCDLDQVAEWNDRFHNPNWRVVFGPSGIFGLDCDVPPLHKHDGVANLATLIQQHGDLPPHPILQSGGGGACHFFRHDNEKIIGHDGHPALGIDPRRGRQSQTIPPSLHHRTRKPYCWLTPPWTVSPPTAPAWLLSKLSPKPLPAIPTPDLRTGDQARKYAVGALRNAVRRVAAIQTGRNNALNAEAYSMARFVTQSALTEDEVRVALSAAARANGLIAEDGIRAVLATIDSGLRAPRP